MSSGLESGIEPGSRWQHHEGDVVTIVTICTVDMTHARLVVFRRERDGSDHAITVSRFRQEVRWNSNDGVRIAERFTPVAEDCPRNPQPAQKSGFRKISRARPIYGVKPSTIQAILSWATWKTVATKKGG